jgi:uncharacterized membrane protein
MTRYQTAGRIAARAADRFNPIMGGPSAPLKTRALFAAFGPSLMPRASLHQGLAAGISVLAAELVGRGVDAGIRRVVPDSSPFAMRMGARAIAAAAGLAVSQIPETDDEPTPKASVRSAGRLVAAGAIGGAINEAGMELRGRFPGESLARPIIGGVAGAAGWLYYSKSLLDERQAVITPWSDEDRRASLPASIGIAIAVASLGRGIGRGFMASRRASIRYFGEDRSHAAIGRIVNTAMWAAGGAGLYGTVVAAIASKNEEIEPAYSEPPDNPYVSGGPNSISPFDELGLQGRRFVTDVITPDLIESAMREKAIAHPIRAYVGVNSDPLYPSGRSEMMLDEMERLGAFERSHLLLFCPTGTGWVDQTMIEAMELFTRGDVATACIQYGRGPSFLEVQKVHLGRAQFRGLLWGVKMRLQAIPEADRPKVVIFGERLGSWASSDVVMFQCIEGFDHYGIDHALWFGLVGLAKWSKTGMREGRGTLVSPGTVKAFDHFGEYEELTDEEKKQLRAVIVDHDNDPIAQMSFRSAVKRPSWLSGPERGRNVPEGMQWVPLITYVQIMIDAMNAMRVVPGQFKSFGHDYRGDTADFVHAAYQLPPVTDEQKHEVHEMLLKLEVERGERIKNAKQSAKAAGERTKRTKRLLLRDRGVIDIDEAAIEVTPGDAPADIQ